MQLQLQSSSFKPWELITHSPIPMPLNIFPKTWKMDSACGTENWQHFKASSPYLRMPTLLSYFSQSEPPESHVEVHPCNWIWVISNTSWDFRSAAALKPFNPIGELLTAKRWTLPPQQPSYWCKDAQWDNSWLGQFHHLPIFMEVLVENSKHLKYWSQEFLKVKIYANQVWYYAYNTYPFSKPTYLLHNIRHAC